MIPLDGIPSAPVTDRPADWIGWVVVILTLAIPAYKLLKDSREASKLSAGDRIDKLTCRMDDMEARERVRDDYILELRMHISDGKPPPPPAWPATLLPKDHA